MTRQALRHVIGPAIVVSAVAYLTVLHAQDLGVLRHAIPPGAVIAVRTIDVIDSKDASPDAEFRATVDDAVVDGDVSIVPIGAPAFLKVMQLEQAGAVRGRAALGLRLVAVELDGQRVSLESGDATIRSGSQGAKATKAGIGGAVVGGLLGGLLGGQGGAVRGAALGAGAGVAAAAVSGQRVRVPAETRLSFTVSAPDEARVR